MWFLENNDGQRVAADLVAIRSAKNGQQYYVFFTYDQLNRPYIHLASYPSGIVANEEMGGILGYEAPTDSRHRNEYFALDHLVSSNS